MPGPRLIVVSPMLSASTACVVAAAEGGGLRTCSRRSEVVLGPLRTAFAARAAGAEVLFLSLAEPLLATIVRPLLVERGVEPVLLQAPAAAREKLCYQDESGATLFAVDDVRTPAALDVDRLLDEIARLLAAGPAAVVVAADLEGKHPMDFAERVVGRARGLGADTYLAQSGPPLWQAFHATPCAAILPEEEIALLLPRADGREEKHEETLRRLFEDPLRILLLCRQDGGVRAVTRDAARDLGPLGAAESGELMGALAARCALAGGDCLRAAVEALALLARSEAVAGQASVASAAAGPASGR
ncbi:MAG: hypothetical protein HY812_15890 [Planctomycetes bacterium]|nr:hypothetical protein [Planctomycetota bacterium]